METQDALSLFRLAEQWAVAGEVQKALDALRTLVLVDPYHHGIWEGLASCHDQLGQPAVAASLRAIGTILTAPQLEDGSS